MSIIKLPNIKDGRGELSFVENKSHIPFEIKRVFYLYNIPDGAERGGHAHKKCQQLIIPISGSFYVTLKNGIDGCRYRLDNPSEALYVAPYIWNELSYFAPKSVCLVLASELYDELDYIRNYQDFLDVVKRI